MYCATPEIQRDVFDWVRVNLALGDEPIVPFVPASLSVACR